MLPKHVRYQAALHPGCFHRRRSFPTTLYIILHRRAFVNTFFADSLEFFPSRVLPRISGENAPLPHPATGAAGRSRGEREGGPQSPLAPVPRTGSGYARSCVGDNGPSSYSVR